LGSPILKLEWQLWVESGVERLLYGIHMNGW